MEEKVCVRVKERENVKDVESEKEKARYTEEEKEKASKRKNRK